MTDELDTLDQLDTLDPLECARIDYAGASVDFRYWQSRHAQRPDTYTELRLAYASEALHRAHDRLQLALAGVYDHEASL